MKKLIGFFNRIVCVFPFGVAVIFSTVYYTGGWGRWFPLHDLAFYFEYPISCRFPVALLYLLSFVFLACMHKEGAVRQKRRVVEVLFIWFLAFSIRFSVIYYSGQLSPFSDFLRVWEIAHGKLAGNIDYYTCFPAYLNYSVLIRRFLLFVGDHFEYTLYANALLSSSTAVVVYLIMDQIMSKAAFLAGVLYAVMPANILYNTVMTPEFLTIFLFCLAVLLLLITNKKSGCKRVALLLLAGILLGVSASYKQFSIIIIIAAIMCGAAELIMKKAKKRTIIMSAVLCLILIFGYHFSQSFILKDTERQYKLNVDNRAAIVHFLLVGLNTEGEGQIHVGGLSRTFLNQILKGTEAKEAEKNAIIMLRSDWSEHANRLPKLLVKKLIWAWQDDTVPVYYYNVVRGQSGTNCERWFGLPLSTLTQTYYLGIMLLGLVGTSFIAKNYSLDLGIEFVLLIIFGYFCLIVLSEAQSRYKCLVMPFISMIAAVGITEICRGAKVWLDHISNRVGKGIE